MNLDNEELKATKNRQVMELSKEEQEAIRVTENVKDIKLYSYDYVKILLNIIEKLQKENEKQSKVIDEMAEYIRVKTDFTTVGNIYAIKQYFYRKAENNENN